MSSGARAASLATHTFQPSLLRRMLKFYAPWCGHCKRMAPVLQEIAAELGSPTVRFGKVDCTVETRLRTQWNVTGYPAVFMVRGGRHWRHTGLRNKPALVDLVKRMQADAVRKVSQAGDVQAMLEPGRVAFFLAEAEGEQGAATLFQAAATNQKHVLNFVSSRELDVARAVAGASANADAWKRPFVAKLEAGEQPVLLPGASIDRMDQEKLEQWMLAHRLPLVSLVGGHNFHELSKAGRLVALLLTDPCEGAPCRSLRRTLVAELPRAAASLQANTRATRPSANATLSGLTSTPAPRLPSATWLAHPTTQTICI